MEQLKHYWEVWSKYPLYGDIDVLMVLQILLSLWIGLFVLKKIFGFLGRLARSKARVRNAQTLRHNSRAKQKPPAQPKPEGKFKKLFSNLIQDISGYKDTLKDQVPSRVLDEMKNSQNSSEIYVAGLQLVIIFILGLVYFYSGSVKQEISLFSPISTALILYTLFTLARLILAMTRSLGIFLLILSIIVDFSILGFVILSLRHDMGVNDPLFYFSFILIALRTLRFQPIWVFLAGFCAFVCCAVVALYAGNIHATEEMAKLLSVLVVTIILMISQFMAKQTSYKASRSQSAVSDLSHFFDQDVVKKIITQEAGPDLTTAERRLATIMFVDLRGFTLLSREQSATKTINLIKDYQNLIVPVIRKNNGSIDKFMGDGILASFGAVQEEQTFAKNALEAAREIMEVFNKWRAHQLLVNEPAPHIGMGLASGEIIYGIIGDEVRYEYTVMGDAVNFAAKLEKHTKIQEVPMLCDDETVQLARKQGSDIKMQSFEGVRIEGVPGYRYVWTIDTKIEPPKDAYFK